MTTHSSIPAWRIPCTEEPGRLLSIGLYRAAKEVIPMYLPEAQRDVVWAAVGSPWGLSALWLVVINLLTFFVFGWDKLKAKWKEKNEKTRRVPEKTLFLLAP